ncbi:MAG: MFS transporter [Planktomarina sp.]
MRAPLIILTVAYVFSQFYRAFLAVLAAPLEVEIGATAAQLSNASGLWFLCFALMQIPVGWALDTIGPRRTNAALFGICAAGGAFVFAGATTPWHISLAMSLIGIGCSPVLMSAYYIVARSFPSAAFATMAAFIIGVGSLGNIGAAGPMTFMVDLLGWRTAMAALGAVTMIVALATYIFVRDPPKVESSQKGSVLDLLKMPAMWLILPMMLVNYAPAAGLRGLWIGPYFSDVFGSTAAQVATATTIMAVAMIIGNFAYGPLDRIFKTRKWVIFTGNLCGGLLCVALYMFGGANYWSAIAIFAGIGLFGASFPVLVAHARSFFPDHLVGRGVTLINMFGIGGAGIMQRVSGPVYDANIADGTAAIVPYNAVFLLFFVTMSIGLAIYAFSEDRTG